MPPTKKPTDPICKKAATYAGVDQGTACNQSSFKVGKKAFLYIGPQGGRYKAMFKLKDSMPQAKKLAKDNPDDYQTGSTGWVTARFSEDEPLPKRIWEKWLAESYALSAGSAAPKKKTAKKKKTSTAKKKPIRKKAAAKTTTKKKSSKKQSSTRKR